MILHIFWEIVKYSDYPTFSGLFPNKKHIPKLNDLSLNLQGPKEIQKEGKWKLLYERS